MQTRCRVTVYRAVVRVTYGRTYGAAPAGGQRSAVTRFSPASRRRLIAAIAEAKSPPDLFVTLTYPQEFPSLEVAKEQMRRCVQHVVRRGAVTGNRNAVVWRLELQNRGAAHFHILWWFSRYPVQWSTMCGSSLPISESVRSFAESRQWSLQDLYSDGDPWKGAVSYLSALWCHYVGSTDAAFLNRGVDVQEIRGDTNEERYITKYASKLQRGRVVDEDTGEILSTGRWWGKIGSIDGAARRVLAEYEISTDDGWHRALPELWQSVQEAYAIECEDKSRRRYSVLTDGRRAMAAIDAVPSGWLRIQGDGSSSGPIHSAG